ncbi:AEG_G0049300.mRNA.1.CDS.1 [Saccharomyces cerevisiae]|nr:Cmk2p [Saccharomyces cerevisiae PE-2]CAI4754463.1 BDC_1c_G0049190.mRNA.1.CDS.1 [Saccharomyces cerevisiae]CAF1605377.1 Cmk2p [Saccharomyces cerevisiae PE-2]CAI4759391.1 BDF_1d_G0049090.mRNA.1.CDS.1 [Saccharomyces cerevisiae]CAI4774508.1 AEG_G0049300.mRNA.1.CDS.1 [Saccharomyces cerevisiae]
MPKESEVINSEFHVDVQDPERLNGHPVAKFINKLSGQPESYVNRTNYIFGRTLGAGSFGVVRQARKLSTNEDVAIKILLKKALQGNNVQLQMLYEELSILQKLSHPNIVSFKDWFESKDKFYIVTQLATGGELFDRILSRGKFTEVDAVEIIVQILGAVEYMHSKNVVHRDLKPENVLYVDKSENSPLVIADFGIAKQLKGEEDLIYKAAGSLGYVAPEVLTQDGHGKPCDIWSIGVITYTLLCGYSPFIAESVEGFMEECTASRYPVTFHMPYWDNISIDAKRFILKALRLNPADRPTATELLDDPWITSKRVETSNILPDVKKGFSLRKKLRDAIEIVKLNNRIKRLRNMYSLGDDGDNDIEENSLNESLLDGVTHSLGDLRLQSQKKGGELTEEQMKLKSALTKDAFVQIVKAATKNKHKVLAGEEEDDSKKTLHDDRESKSED